jgi:hypothetical protein
LFPISKNDFQGTKLGKSVDRNAVCVHNRIMEKKIDDCLLPAASSKRLSNLKHCLA